MDAEQELLADWVADEILPHEAMVRGWLVRRWGRAVDVDEVLQEAYCRIAALRSVDHIDSGRAYFFATVRSVIMDSMRRAKVANIRSMTEIDWQYVIDESPLPDRVIESRQQLERVRAALDSLPELSRQIIRLRRVLGLSQKETARQLGVSEHMVENHVIRGLRKVLVTMARGESQLDDRTGGALEQP